MKYLIVLCCVVAAAIADQYSGKYDDMNIDDFLDNKKLMQSMANCISDKGPCSPEGKELKSHMKDALENGCANCTPVQKEKTPVVIKRLIKDYPELWKQAVELYDPTGKYQKEYEKLAAEHGITLP